MAALIAIEKRIFKGPIPPNLDVNDLHDRKKHGLEYLKAALNSWNVRSCMHVGFEVLVPALLSLLEM